MVFQNTTARYNGYYNATVLLEESRLALDEQTTDNYNKILPIYKYVEADNPKAVANDLDEAIKKVSVVVNLHRASHWTDDCYLLLGKAQYLKQDYEAAEETFEYLADEFSPEAMAKKEAEIQKKKKRGKKIAHGSSRSGHSGAVKDKEAVKSKKLKNKEIQHKKKEREKVRKQRNKQIKKKRNQRKKGKSSHSSASKKKKPPAHKKKSKEATEDKKEESKEKPKEEKKKNPRQKKTEEEDTPVPDKISLGELEPQVIADSKPESYFMKHRPAYQEGILWLARTYIERENFSNADRLIEQLDQNSGTFEDIRQQLAVVQAYYYMKRKDYESVIPALENAISLSKSRKDKARYTFIIAQLYQQADQGDAAYATYEKALKYGPNYDMAFNARLKLAENAWLNGKGTAEQAVKNLEKMLKDIKNTDFKDQIYFAIADIALKQDDRKTAIDNLRLSLNNSTKNKFQKAESYLLLAQLYFEVEDFVNAKLYYDSTVQVLPKTDERFTDVNRLNDNLTEIANNLRSIHLQDSLLLIYKMTKDEKRELAFQIQKEREEAKIKAAAKTAARKGGGTKAVAAGLRPTSVGGRPGRTPTATRVANKSSFFAYDDRGVKRGQREFQRAWGGRPLEDNWRRSNQKSFDNLGSEIETTTAAAVALTDEEIDKILKNVPKTEKDVEAANRIVEAALFALGNLYRDRLENNQKAIESLEELLKRYPGTQFQLDAYYYLYLAHSDLGHTKEAKFYFDKIIREYPNTTYAKVLQDPSYLKQILDDRAKLNQFYDETYAAFQKGQYQVAFNRIQQVTKQFGAKNSLQPRFALLSAMCLGNLKGRPEYVEALKGVVGKYPGTPEQIRAKEILRLLGAISASGHGQQRKGAKKDLFKTEPNRLHYIIVVFNGDVKLNKAKIAVSDYNRRFHKLEKLRISNIYLGGVKTKIPIIVIRRFKDKKKAMEYYDGVQKNKKSFVDPSLDYSVFPITQNNYRQILKSKSISGYQEFFELNYLN